eukprot:PhM_4_TR7202/c0_g1_i1/m.51395/K00809/DHPS, dys; deoxyhypusine synthase
MSENCDKALNAVFVKSEEVGDDAIPVAGAVVATTDAMLQSYATTGFQASNLGKAVTILKEMQAWRYVAKEGEDDYSDDPLTVATFFVAFTCPMVGTVVRDALAFLARHNQVHVLITSGGGVEVDVARTLGDTDTSHLPKFSEWCRRKFVPIVREAIKAAGSNVMTPSKIAALLGTSIDDVDSFTYWAAKNSISIYIPSFSDGTLAEILADEVPELVVDLVEDIRGVNRRAMKARRTGMLILGGGVVKHHTCNANLMRNGADHAVYVNTGEEYDGSDGGARPEEAISWGKISGEAKHVKVHADASIVVPMLMAQVFVPNSLTAQH